MDKLCVNVTVNSGSEVTTIKYDFYEGIGSPRMEKKNVKLMGTEKNKFVPLVFFYRDIVIDNCEVNCKIYVLDKLCNEIVVCIDMIQKQKWFPMAMRDLNVRQKGIRKYQ